ncbi:MAG: hypothetical protein WCP29_16555 [Acidobacteriota bacterium]
MVPLMSLALPIALSAVIAFVASSIIHMLLPYHHGDFKRLPREDDVQAALRGFNIPPGNYALPAMSSPSEMKSPAFLEKMNNGPVMLMTVSPSGPPAMGKAMGQWFVHLLLVGLFSGYIASRALGPGAHYLSVFRFVGCSAFMAYAFGHVQNAIWYRRSWSTTCKDVFDGLVYALLTAGTFGWLWPR